MVRALMYGANILDFLKHRNIYIHTLLYEDLISNTKEELEKLFTRLDISTHLVSYAQEAMKYDSQGGIFSGKNEGIFGNDDWKHCNAILQEYGLSLTTNMSVKDLRIFMSL